MGAAATLGEGGGGGKALSGAGNANLSGGVKQGRPETISRLPKLASNIYSQLR